MEKNKQSEFLLRFGKRLIELRKSKGFSQEQLAYDCEISLSSISKLERGLLNISIENVNKIATALGVEIKEFFN